MDKVCTDIFPDSTAICNGYKYLPYPWNSIEGRKVGELDAKGGGGREERGSVSGGGDGR